MVAVTPFILDAARITRLLIERVAVPVDGLEVQQQRWRLGRPKPCTPLAGSRAEPW